MGWAVVREYIMSSHVFGDISSLALHIVPGAVIAIHPAQQPMTVAA